MVIIPVVSLVKGKIHSFTHPGEVKGVSVNEFKTRGIVEDGPQVVQRVPEFFS